MSTATLFLYRAPADFSYNEKLFRRSTLMPALASNLLLKVIIRLMHKPLLHAALTIFLIGCSVSNNQPVSVPQNTIDNEAQVYSAVIDSKYSDVTNAQGKKADLLLIQNVTSVDMKRFQEYRQHMLSASQITLDDFQGQNKQTYPLKQDLNIHAEYKFITEQEIGSLVSTKKGTLDWSSFYAKYPDAGGVIFLSKVGFNHEQTEALVEVSRGCGRGCGEGAFFLLIKVDGVWKIKDNYGGWMS